MASHTRWFHDPLVREIGTTRGIAALQAYLAEQGRAIPEATLRGRFSTEHWPWPGQWSEAAQRREDAKKAECCAVRPESIAQHKSAFTSDKKIGRLNWREANKTIRQMQAIKHEASWSQDKAHFEIDTDHEICVLLLSDLHMGSWGCDYETLERVTDELLSTPDLYAYLLGDEENMAIKMRNVLEVSDDLLPPELSGAYFESWLDEVQSKVLGATWSNHAEMREEAQAGRSLSKIIKNRRVVYHNGIGHADIKVGGETYTWALSHVFRGRSLYSATHSQVRYGRFEAHDREIIAAGDTHIPEIRKYWESGRVRLAINGGSALTNSGYAKRFFSLTTAEVWPCVVLQPDTHVFTPYWSIAEWLRTQKKAS